MSADAGYQRNVQEQMIIQQDENPALEVLAKIDEPTASRDNENADKEVEISITTISSVEAKVYVFNESDTIANVMHTISMDGGPATPEQRLLHGDRALSDPAATLGRLGLTGEVSLTLLAVSIQWVAEVTAAVGDLGNLAKGLFFNRNSFTVEAWVKLNSVTQTYTRTLLASGPGGQVFSCGFSHGRPEMVMDDTRLTVPGEPTVGSWIHVAFVYDKRAKRMRILVGGEEVAAKEDVKPLTSTSPDVRIGASAASVYTMNSTGAYKPDKTGRDFLEGLLASLGIWTVTISEQDLRLTLESGPPPPQRGFVAGLCRYWTFHHNFKNQLSSCLDGVTRSRTDLKRDQVVEAKDRPF